MSEPNQLYARVRLSRAKLDDFLTSQFPDPSGDDAVLSWLSEAPYYGDRYTPEVIRERLAFQTTVGAWVDWLVAPASYGLVMPSRNAYDEASRTWTLAVLDFSENYDDYIAAVAVFREIAKYKDVPSDDGFVIFAYMFGNGEPDVALRIKMGTSEFLEPSAAESLLTDAAQTMEALMAEGAAAATLGTE